MMWNAPDPLAALLIERPEIIPPSAIRGDAVALRLALNGLFPGPPGSGLLAFSPQGDVAVIESRAGTDDEGGACAVLGRVLEDAAAIGGTTYLELDAAVRERHGLSLAGAMERRLAAAGVEDWDRDAFEKRAGEAVQSGDVALVIALGARDERLLRTIRFIWEAWAVVLPLHVVLLSGTSGDWQPEVVY